MALSVQDWADSSWGYFRSRVPTADLARRQNPTVVPQVPDHNVPRTLLDCICRALHPTVLAATVTIEIPVGAATTGTPNPGSPRPHVTYLVPDSGTHGLSYRQSIGAVGRSATAIGALVEGPLEYLLAEAYVQLAPLSPPYGLAVELTGIPSSVDLSEADLTTRLRAELLESKRFSRQDRGVELTPEAERHLVATLVPALAAGVRSIRFLPFLTWSGTPSSPPVTNPTPLWIGGQFE